MKALDYDVMVLGNNDFRVYPAGEGTPDSRYEQLKDYHRNVNFPILTGDVIDKETESISRMSSLGRALPSMALKSA